MGNLATPPVCMSSILSTSDSQSIDESSEVDFTEFQSYSHYGDVFGYADAESIYHCLKHTIDGILSIRRFEQWSTISILDLRRQKLTALNGLGTILPSLECLVLSDNLIQELSGLPTSIRTLKINRNRLTEINGILFLKNLQYLDVGNNAISSFKGIKTLQELRIIHAENNKASSCTDFQFMRCLNHLNLRGNRLEKRIVFSDSALLDNLEILDISYNRIGDLEFTNGLNKLRVLKLEHNELESLIVKTPLVNLKSLYLCFNRLTEFDGSFFPDLRTLHADENHISCFLFMDSIPRLSEVTLRDQCDQLGEVDLQNFAGARNLLLAGNTLRRMNTLVNFVAIEYLELCSAKLDHLPHDFAHQTPNIAILCLGHNYLSSIKPLRKLKKLHKLVLVNNRLKNMNNVVKCLRSMDALRYVDLRDNPISFKYYASTVTDTGPRKRTCQCVMETRNTDWFQQDNDHLQAISPIWLQRRSIYRALVIKSSSDLLMLDGLPVSLEERSEALVIVSQHYQQIKLKRARNTRSSH